MNRRNELMLWNDSTWRPVTDLRREVDRVLNDFWLPNTRSEYAETHFVPACDIEEESGHYLLTLEMPGISKDNLKIEVIENQMIVSGERKNEKKGKVDGGWYSERQFGKFQRSFTLPAGIDTNKIEAHYNDGVLRLTVPKAESTKPRQIKISHGSNGFFGKILGPPKNEKEETQTSNESRKEKVAS